MLSACGSVANAWFSTSQSPQLGKSLTHNLHDDVDIGLEEIYEALAGTTTDVISISTHCEKSEEAPSSNGVSYHLMPSSTSKPSNQ